MQSISTCIVTLLLAAGMGIGSAQAQHQDHQKSSSENHGQMPLAEPGNAIFGTVQEAIKALEADPATDWSNVDMEQLRQHLIDMHRVAVNVAVVEKKALEGGVRLVVEPTTDNARAPLQRVLDVHPAMLQQETGWQMKVESRGDQYVLRVTDPQGAAADKIRGLGYIGLLAYGPHHQHHHWRMVRGGAPHQH